MSNHDTGAEAATVSRIYLGLMSGTSVDAIDAALLQCSTQGMSLLATHEHAIPPTVRSEIIALSHSGGNEIERLGSLDRTLGELFAAAAGELLASANCPAESVTAIGSHGQTVRHRPPSAPPEAGAPFTLQIGDPNSIAELTGITTVADFRRRDIACGGEGAPLAPAFHAAAFGANGVTRAIVNIGGIANLSLLSQRQLLAGFDTGPGNTLLDHWIARHQGLTHDAGGAWSTQGEPDQALLEALLKHPHLTLRGPRSTGKEAFNLAWLDAALSGLPGLTPVQVQATLAEFTARTIADAVDRAEPAVTEVFVCGGGCHNQDLMGRLQRLLPGVTVGSTALLGIDPDWVEAAAFAWLASRTLDGLAGNAPAVTGAAGERVLGAVYPA